MQSEKFDEKDSKRVWRSFKGARNPIRMPTLIQAANANRLAKRLDSVLDDDLGKDSFRPPAKVALIKSRNSVKHTLHNAILFVRLVNK